jgi:hypothetical protein
MMCRHPFSFLSPRSFLHPLIPLSPSLNASSSYCYLSGLLGRKRATVRKRTLTLTILLCRWSSLGIKLANLTRSKYVYNATVGDIFAGSYVEAGPNVIMAVFLFFGSTFFLYIKARMGPGPFVFATVLACLCLGTVFALTRFPRLTFYG